MKTSFSYKCSNIFFKFINYKAPLKNDKALRRFLLKKGQGNKKFNPISKSLFLLKYDKKYINNMEYYEFNKNGDKKVLFIPGGSYVDNPTEIHFQFIEKLVKEANCHIYMPIYPKLPTYTYINCYKCMDELLNIIGNDCILIGDSAGGGLGLGLYLKHGKNTFIKSILISPWVDIRMNNTKMIEIEKKDPILSIEGLKKLGSLWSLNRESYLTSPIIGDLEILDNLYIFTGTNEIFYPDIIKFYKLCKGNINLYEYKEMNHGFVLHPIKEAKEASNLIIEILKN